MEVLVEVWLKFGGSFAAGFGSQNVQHSIVKNATIYHSVKRIAQGF